MNHNRFQNHFRIGGFKNDKNAGGASSKKAWRIFGYVCSALLTVALVGMITGIVVVSTFFVYVSKYIDPTIDESLLITGAGEQTTKIYYYDFTDRTNRIGNAVELEDQRIYGAENSLWASYEEIPDYLREAFISIEDKRFMTHNGVDWHRTAGAVLNFFLGFDDSSYGGSTITQQLIKNVTGDDDATIQRKVQEILRALNLEKKMSKTQIIELYLNIVPLSQNCVGVRAAAETYFGKELSELTLAECASLAAITKYPTKYDPFQNPENNIKRRNDVLDEMNKQGKISDAEYEAALDEPLTLKDENDDTVSSRNDQKVNSWYIDTVICDVRDDLMEQYGLTKEIASNLINSGGLSIYTLMDPHVQTVMEEVFADDANFPKNTGGIPAESAAVVIDPNTGDLLGVVGARGEKRGNLILNYATQTQRAPGSSIKPLSVYGPALEEGIITYGSVYDDTPLWFNGNTPYPKNTPDVYRGLTTINSAIERSVNTVAMKVLEDLTLDKSYDYLKNKFGFSYLIDGAEDKEGRYFTDKGLAALALGQLNYGVTVRDLAAAYTVFPTGGVKYDCNSYLYVYDNSGNLLLSNESNGHIVFSEQTSYIMTKMMQNVVNKGTATSVSLRKQMDVAGKTGTAGNDYDRWFAGFTPYYVGAVWYGYSYPKALTNVGANPSNKIFDLIMTELHKDILADAKRGGTPLKTFDDLCPADIVKVAYCKDSGKLIGDACRLDPRGDRSDVGYFTTATVPTEYCDCHVVVKYDKSTGGVAHEYSNPEDLYDVALIAENKRSFPYQVNIEDAQYVYRNLPHNVRPAGWWGVPFFQMTIPDGTYIGITNLKGGRQFNSFSYENYDFSRFDAPSAPVTTQNPTDEIDNDIFEDVAEEEKIPDTLT